jgi:hypothetical protein
MQSTNFNGTTSNTSSSSAQTVQGVPGERENMQTNAPVSQITAVASKAIASLTETNTTSCIAVSTLPQKVQKNKEYNPFTFYRRSLSRDLAQITLTDITTQERCERLAQKIKAGKALDYTKIDCEEVVDYILRDCPKLTLGSPYPQIPERFLRLLAAIPIQHYKLEVRSQSQIDTIARSVLGLLEDQWLHDRYNCRLVEGRWIEGNLRPFKIPEELQPMMEAIRPYVRSLWCAKWNVGIDNFLPILRYFPKLHELDLSYHACAENFPANEVLSNHDLAVIAELNPDLRKLDLSMNTGITGEGIDSLTHYCPHIQEIDIGGCEKITAQASAKLLGNLHELKTVSFFYSSNLAPEWNIIAPYLKQIKSLNLSFCKLTDEQLNIVLSGCPNLESLQLHENRALTEQAITIIANRCPKLRNLDAWTMDGNLATDASLRVLAQKCRFLESLKFFEGDCTDYELMNFAIDMRNIKEFEIGWANNLTERGMQFARTYWRL